VHRSIQYALLLMSSDSDKKLNSTAPTKLQCNAYTWQFSEAQMPALPALLAKQTPLGRMNTKCRAAANIEAMP
jgi:hypothetical protein